MASLEAVTTQARRASSPHPFGKPLPPEDLDEALLRAAHMIRHADALLICSGAGMGADCGLGTYRGRNAGVWGPLKALQLEYSVMCDPDWFESDPRLAWAYWHFCYEKYTTTEPHLGYDILAKWGRALHHGVFSVTTNIDGHWERILGATSILECHGTVSQMQRSDDSGDVWPTSSADLAELVVPEWDLAPGEAVEVRVAEDGQWMPAIVGDDGFSIFAAIDCQTARQKVHSVRRPGGNSDFLRVSETSMLPQCHTTKSPARPNVLMFGDFQFNTRRMDKQRNAYESWKASLPGDANLVVVEIGAGRAIPVARDEAVQAMKAFPNAKLIRINLEDGNIGRRDVNAHRSVSIGVGALEALVKLESLLTVAFTSDESGEERSM